MKTKFFISLFAAIFFAIGSFAADKLAIAEPVGKGGVKAEDIEAFLNPPFSPMNTNLFHAGR